MAGPSRGPKESKVVTGATEHSAVLRPCEAMEAVGYDVSCVVCADGRLDLDHLGELVESTRPGFAWYGRIRDRGHPPVAEACTAKEVGWAFTRMRSKRLENTGGCPGGASRHLSEWAQVSCPQGVGALYVRQASF